MVRVRLYNRADQLVTINRAVGYEVIISSLGDTGFISSAAGDICIASADELRTAPYITNVSCVGTGRYVTIRAPLGQYLHLTEVQVYAANSCPPRLAQFATELPGSNCGNAGYGGLCVQTCLPGYVPVSGSQTSVCRGSGWDSAALVCQPTCPELAPPTYAEDCAKTMIADDFTFRADNKTLERWMSLDPGNSPIGRAWFAADDMVQASAKWGCGGELMLVPASPEIRDFQGSFTAKVSVSTKDRAGIIRALDKANYIRFYIDVLEGVHVLDKVINGKLTKLSDATLAITADTWYQISFTQTGNAISIALNGVEIIATSDRSLRMGYVGLYAGTSAQFDDFSLATDCTSCSGAVPQDRCTFTCRPGLIQTGNATRVCTVSNDSLTADWSGVPTTCALPPPIFNSAVRAIAENSPRNSLVGEPLVAYLTSPDETVSFALVSTSPLPAAGPPFWIDRCSGQLRVRTPSVLDYETYRSFRLNVSAYVQGFDGAVTYRAVTVNLLDVNEPPVIATGQVFNISESATIGDVIGRIRYSDPENSTTVFSIVADASNGAVTFANATQGLLAVASTTGLNFEGGDTRFEVVISARDPWDAAMSATGLIYLQVVDGPDLPVMRAGQILRIIDASAGVGSSFQNTIQASLEDNPAGRFNSPLTYTVIPLPQARSFCSINDTEVATTTGTDAGAMLFAANPLTGGLQVLALPAAYPPWSSRPTFALEGSFARAAYTLCVNVSSRYRWAVGSIRASVVANLQNVARITGYVVGNGQNGTLMDTLFPPMVTFLGSDLGGANASVITANYTNPDLGLTFIATGCTVVNSSAITCQAARGVGKDLIWTVYRNGEPLPSTVQLNTDYYPPVVTGISNHTNVPSEGGQYIILPGVWKERKSGTSPYIASLAGLSAYTLNHFFPFFRRSFC